MTVTVQSLPTSSSQEVFDTIAAHLLKQLEVAQEGGLCRYRTEDGLKCAAGCLIPDDLYNDRIEGNSWGAVLELKDWPKDHDTLIISLQGIHDTYAPPSWKSGLKSLADDFGLKFNF